MNPGIRIFLFVLAFIAFLLVIMMVNSAMDNAMLPDPTPTPRR